jgi:hypothetical protein
MKKAMSVALATVLMSGVFAVSSFAADAEKKETKETKKETKATKDGTKTEKKTDKKETKTTK